MIENLQKDLTIDFYLSVDTKNIQNYLLGAINCFIRRNNDTWFKAKDIILSDWNGTPLQNIYDFFETNGLSEEESWKKAGMCLGKILKKTISDDSRIFETRKFQDNPREYRLKPNNNT